MRRWSPGNSRRRRRRMTRRTRGGATNASAAAVKVRLREGPHGRCRRDCSTRVARERVRRVHRSRSRRGGGGGAGGGGKTTPRRRRARARVGGLWIVAFRRFASRRGKAPRWPINASSSSSTRGRADSPYPEGHYVRSLGKLGDADAETAAVLLEADVDDRPFAPAVHACVPPLPWSFDEREHLSDSPTGRTSSLRVCSVDPPGCRDIDDALSCRALDPEGKFLELGVHIADVTEFSQTGHRHGPRGAPKGHHHLPRAEAPGHAPQNR